MTQTDPYRAPPAGHPTTCPLAEVLRRRQPGPLRWVALSLAIAQIYFTPGELRAQAIALPGMGSDLAAVAAGSSAAPSRSQQFLPGVRGTVLETESSGGNAGGRSHLSSVEITPYLNASIATARTQGSVAYAMRNFETHSDAGSRAFTRHDLRATLNAQLIDDWFGIQASAAIYNTNASIAGGLSADPATSPTNNAALRTWSVAPYVQGRAGGLATYRMQYRYQESDTTGNVQAALASQTHSLSVNVASGPQFNPWGWALNGTGLRREFANQVSLDSTSAVATLFYTPTPEWRLGGTLNYRYIERLTNSQGRNRGWGPGASIDWNPGRRTTIRGTIARQYFGTTESLRLSHRTNQLLLGLNYDRSILQSNDAALLTYNPGTLFSGEGFQPSLNPLYTQLTGQGVLPADDVVLGATVINDALVRNRTLVASAAYAMPRWTTSATLFRSVRETVLSSTVFGIPVAQSRTSFGQFTTTGASLAATLSIDARKSLIINASTRDIEASASSTKTRFSIAQANLNWRISPRASASIGARHTVQTTDAIGVSDRRDNTVFATFALQLR